MFPVKSELSVVECIAMVQYAISESSHKNEMLKLSPFLELQDEVHLRGINMVLYKKAPQKGSNHERSPRS